MPSMPIYTLDDPKSRWHIFLAYTQQNATSTGGAVADSTIVEPISVSCYISFYDVMQLVIYHYMYDGRG